MNFNDSIRWDPVDQVQSRSKWRAGRVVADDFGVWKLIGRVKRAETGMQNEFKESRSGGFSIVASDDASKFFFGADDTFCFWYKCFVEDGVVSSHTSMRSIRIIMANPSC